MIVSMSARLRSKSRSASGEELVAHVLAQFGDEPQPLGEEEALGERRGDVALVAKEAAKEPAHQAGNRLAVVDVARGEAEGQQLATVVDDQMAA